MTVLELDECACGQPATRTLGARPYCDECAEEVLGPIRAKHPSNGQQVGPLRQDYGKGWAELACTACGYTWVGMIGEPCGRCMDGLEGTRKAKLALAPPPSTNGRQNATQDPISDSPDDWRRHDLVELAERIAGGDYEPETAQYLKVQGGLPLLYPGRVHSIFGEPGGGKTWIALYAVAERLQDGDPVLLIDWEDSPQGTVTRLLELGCTPAMLKLLDYRNPISGLWQGWQAIDVDTAAWVLVVIDSTGEAMAAAGIKSNDDGPVAEWMALAKRLARTGAAVLLLDHVPKNVENRDMEIGSQRKQAAITGASYRCDTVTSPAKGRDGTLKLVVRKDRLGNRSKGSVAAEVHIMEKDGPLRIEVRVSEAQAAADRGERFRPTHLMERVSRWLELHPGATRRTITNDVTGNKDALATATDLLIEEGYVTVAKVGQSHEHTSVRNYREGFDGLITPVDNSSVPSVPTVPLPSPGKGVGTPESDRPHRPPRELESGGQGTGTVPLGDTISGQPSPPVDNSNLFDEEF